MDGMVETKNDASPATASSGTTKNGGRNSIPKPQHALLGHSNAYVPGPTLVIPSSAPISSCEHRVGLDLDPLRQAGWLMIALSRPVHHSFKKSWRIITKSLYYYIRHIDAAPQGSSGKSGTRGALFSRPPPLDAAPAAILASFAVTPDMGPLLPAFFASTGTGDLGVRLRRPRPRIL
ncbi:hypothetical protein C8R44DRAFT_981779 [Mycena epipterygia]|nr:hypothetical protein C8R44DRAFT_981779 [Mycena epipterygia]